MKHVVAILVKDGKPMAIGSNYHTDCKREGMATGVGYDMCEKCNFLNHAEQECLETARARFGAGEMVGAKLYIYGHTYACNECKKTAKMYGVDVIIKVKELVL